MCGLMAGKRLCLPISWRCIFMAYIKADGTLLTRYYLVLEHKTRGLVLNSSLVVGALLAIKARRYGYLPDVVM